MQSVKCKGDYSKFNTQELADSFLTGGIMGPVNSLIPVPSGALAQIAVDGLRAVASRFVYDKVSGQETTTEGVVSAYMTGFIFSIIGHAASDVIQTVKSPGNSRNSQQSGNQVQYDGKTVTQDNSLFNPHAVDDLGRTNIERMQMGLAPKGYDGKPVNIHHIDQTNSGPVTEISASSHRQNYSSLHSNTGNSASLIDRNAFNKWRGNYWKWRSTD